MSRQLEFDVTLRGQEVSCYVTVCPPEQDIGIMCWSIDNYRLVDHKGNQLDWELSDEELDKLYSEMPNPEDEDDE